MDLQERPRLRGRRDLDPVRIGQTLDRHTQRLRVSLTHPIHNLPDARVIHGSQVRQAFVEAG